MRTIIVMMLAFIIAVGTASAVTNVPDCNDIQTVDDCELEWQGWKLVIVCDDETASKCVAGEQVYTTSEIDALASDFESMIDELSDDLDALESRVDDNEQDISRNKQRIHDLYRKHRALKNELRFFEWYSYWNFRHLYRLVNSLDDRVSALEERVGSLEEIADDYAARIGNVERRGGGIDGDKAERICREVISEEVQPQIDDINRRLSFLESVVSFFHNTDDVSVGKWFTLLKSRMSGQPEMYGDSKCYGYITPWYCISR